jgi:hypothetical protein
MPPKRAAAQNFGSRLKSSSDGSADDDSSQRHRASPSPPSQSVLWVVQDILAERVSPDGHRELLVVWKPEWIPDANIRDGNVWRAFCAAPKVKFKSVVGDVLLPLIPGSSLSTDVRHCMSERQRSSEHAPCSDSASNIAPDCNRGTPRKSVGCTAR